MCPYISAQSTAEQVQYAKMMRLAVLSLILLLVYIDGCQCDTVFSSTYDNPWASENDPTAQIQTSCNPAPCAVGSYKVSAAAARTGQYGLHVTVDKVGAQSWYVQVTVPPIILDDATEYKVCFWAKTDNGIIAGSQEISLDMMQWDTWTWVKSSVLSLNTSWQQLCLSAFKPLASFSPSFDPNNAKYYWAVELGTAANKTNYYFDDFTITATPLNVDPHYLADAPKRIEFERKGNFTVVWTDKNGAPLPKTAITRISLALIQHGFPFGTAMDPEGFDSATTSWYLSTTASLFNAMVPGGRFKWPAYEPQRGSYLSAFELLNGSAYLGFADRNHFVLRRGHALEWLIEGYDFKDHWSRQDGCEQYRMYLKERILRDVSLFRGRFTAYDVWNELLHERAFVDKCDLWKDTVKDAFRWANAADPGAQLCINEYDLIEGDSAPALVSLVKGWLSEGVPVHCIGVQAHIQPDIPTEVIKYRLDTLASLGLPLYITEFDLQSGWSVEEDAPYWSGTEQEQADAYKRYTTLFFGHPAVKGVMWWGWWDSDHWIKDGGIYTPKKKPKAAATMLKDLLFNTWTTKLSAKNPTLDSKGAIKFRGFFGTYQYNVTLSDGRTINGTVSFPSPQPHINTVGPNQVVTVRVPR